MRINDLLNKLREAGEKGKENLGRWAELAQSPAQRKEYNQYVVKPVAQDIKRTAQDTTSAVKDFSEQVKPRSPVESYKARVDQGTDKARAAFGAAAESGVFGPLPSAARSVTQTFPKTTQPISHFTAGLTPLPAEKVALGEKLPEREKYQPYRSAGGLTGAVLTGGASRVPGIVGISAGLGAGTQLVKNAYNIKKEGKPLTLQSITKDMPSSVKQSVLKGTENAPTYIFTQNLVEGLAKSIPALKPLTEKSIEKTLPGADQTIGTWINNLGKTGLKRITKAAIPETLVEALTYGVKESETFNPEDLKDSLAEEAVSNFLYNVGFAGVHTAWDARTIAPVVKDSVESAVATYKAIPPEARQEGFVRIPGGGGDEPTVKVADDVMEGVEKRAGELTTPWQPQGTGLEAPSKATEDLFPQSKDIQTQLEALGEQPRVKIKDTQAYQQSFEGIVPDSAETTKITGKYAEVAQTPEQPSKITLKRGSVSGDSGAGVEAEYPGFNFENWKDKRKGVLGMGRETMERNLEDVAGEDAPKVKKFLLDPLRKNDTARVEWVNSTKGEIESKIKEWNIRSGSDDDALVQRFGEGKIELDELKQETDNWKNVVEASTFFRNKYDNLLETLNSERAEYGYEPIPKREDYFRHFQELGLVSYVSGIFAGKNELPTEIAGLTHIFTPGKPFTSVSIQRKGGPYTESAIKGFDNYIGSVSRQLFHIDSVQRGRALESILRKASVANEDVKLPNFVSNLNEWTNIVSGKKTKFDRAFEEVSGREIYKLMNSLKSRAGANMVGGNISTALTNFIPLTQSIATTDKSAVATGLLRGATFPVEEDFAKIDGVQSDFLVKRFPKGQVDPRGFDKARELSGALFETVDRFTARSIVAGKFYEKMKQGLAPEEAMKQADNYATRLMAQRTIGELPNLINTRALGIFTQFQTEVNNQASFLFKDVPKESKNRVDLAWKVAQIAILSHVYNNISEKMVGYRGAMDPVEYTKTLLGVDEEEDRTLPARAGEVAGEVMQDIPFLGTRLPVEGTVPRPAGVLRGAESLAEGDIEGGSRQLWEEAKRPLFFLGSPLGGGQAKKTLEGLWDYTQGRSETPSGRIRFPIEQTPENLARSALFGRWASPESREYLEGGPSPLGEKQSERLIKIKDPAEQREYYQEIQDRRREGKEPSGGFFQRVGEILGLKEEEPPETIMTKPLPKDIDSLELLYSDAQKTLNSYEEKRTKIEYGDYDEATRREKLMDLEEGVTFAEQMLNRIEGEREDDVFDIQLRTYSKDGSQDVESRVEWAAREFLALETEEEYKELYQEMLDAGVITKSVAEGLQEKGIPANEYSYGSGTRTLSGSASGRTLSISPTPFKPPTVKVKAPEKTGGMKFDTPQEFIKLLNQMPEYKPPAPLTARTSSGSISSQSMPLSAEELLGRTHTVPTVKVIGR